MKSSIMRLAVIRSSAVNALIVIMCGLTARAQNPVSDWNAVALNTIVVTAKKSPPVAPVYFAYMAVAMYDAANSIDHRFTPFAVSLNAPPNASQDAAVVVAAHDVLVHYFPLQQSALDAAEGTSLAAIPAGQSKNDGIAVGLAVAAQWLAIRSGDGLEAPIVFTPGNGPGVWEPVPTFPAPPPNTPPAPLAPWLAQFRPFALASADQFLSEIEPPPDLSSQEWVDDFNRTKAYGALDSTIRTPAQTEIGLFWADHPTAQYTRAFLNLVATQHLGTADAARLAALANVTFSDSLTACFSAKYHFAFWCPYTAIHDADTDGNPDTIADPNWIPLDPTPGHPEYPAAHGCGTEALMDALTGFFGTDKIPYTVTSNVTHTTHDFSSFKDVVREVDAARIYGGMHYHHSVVQGNVLGRKVSNYVSKSYFLPTE
jgi:hypothetical protein